MPDPIPPLPGASPPTGVLTLHTDLLGDLQVPGGAARAAELAHPIQRAEVHSAG